MLRIIRAVVVVIAIAALFTTPSCYTLFQHPRLAELNYARPQQRDCGVCHTPQQLWAFTHPKGYSDKRGAWKDYYDYPWWFDDYWHTQRNQQMHSDDNGADE